MTPQAISNPFSALVVGIKDRPGTPIAHVPVPRGPYKPKRKAVVANPWDLNAYQVAAITALVQAGSGIEAGELLGLTDKAIEAHIRTIKKKMGVANRLLAVLEWDRFIRTQGATQ